MADHVSIDLNADLGEGASTDAALLDIITSANIACGGHAGDEATMRQAVRLALARGVGLGAHPSYPDREGFGRRAMSMIRTRGSSAVSIKTSYRSGGRWSATLSAHSITQIPPGFPRYSENPISVSSSAPRIL